MCFGSIKGRCEDISKYVCLRADVEIIVWLEIEKFGLIIYFDRVIVFGNGLILLKLCLLVGFFFVFIYL